MRRVAGRRAPHWQCLVCGDERPAKSIGLASRTRDLGAAGQVKVSIHYCADDPACVRGAAELLKDRFEMVARLLPVPRVH